MKLDRRTMIRGAAGLLGTAALGLEGEARAEPRRLRTTHHRVPWPGIDRRFRIVQITDVHVGIAVPPMFLERVQEIAWKLEPSLVVLTGDYLNHSLTHLERMKHFVGLLPRPLIATLGNHDHWSGADEIVRALREVHAEVLSNEVITHSRPGIDLTVVGVDDGFTRHDDVARAFRGVSDRTRALVLNHFPSTADRIAEEGARLVLSGHTHGGQIYVPGITDLFQRMAGNRYLAGWFQLDQTRLYVSAGVGASMMGYRAGTQALPEIAVFDLVPGSTPA